MTDPHSDPIPFPDDRHGMTSFVTFRLGDLFSRATDAARAAFADTRIHAVCLHWHGHTYIAPLGTEHHGDGEPGLEWVHLAHREGPHETDRG